MIGNMEEKVGGRKERGKDCEHCWVMAPVRRLSVHEHLMCPIPVAVSAATEYLKEAVLPWSMTGGKSKSVWLSQGLIVFFGLRSNIGSLLAVATNKV